MATAPLDFGLKCIKYLLLVATSIFLFSAVLLIFVGTGFFATFENYRDFFDINYFTPGAMMIVLGIFIFISSFLGWYGALRQSTCMILSFAVLLLIIVSLEIAAGLIAYSREDEIIDFVRTKINSTMHEAEHNPEAAWVLYTTHEALKCCGYNGHEDWKDIHIPEGVFLTTNPCCSSYQFHDSNKFTCNEFYHRGCLDPIKSIIHENALNIVFAAILIALIQFTGIIFACILGCAIRGRKTLREMKKWKQSDALIATGYRLAQTNDTYGPTTY